MVTTTKRQRKRNDLLNSNHGYTNSYDDISTNEANGLHSINISIEDFDPQSINILTERRFKKL